MLRNKNSTTIKRLKNVFGLGNITYNDDFANTIATGINGWQSRNWDPKVNDPSFTYYCENITAHTNLYSAAAKLKPQVEDLIKASGVADVTPKLTQGILNMIGFYNATIIPECLKKNKTIDACFTNRNATFYQQHDLKTQSWRSWAYQYCTQ